MNFYCHCIIRMIRFLDLFYTSCEKALQTTYLQIYRALIDLSNPIIATNIVFCIGFPLMCGDYDYATLFYNKKYSNGI